MEMAERSPGCGAGPSRFGRFSHNLLIWTVRGAEYSVERLHRSLRLTTGKFNGLLQDAGGKPLAIKGILALSPGIFSLTM